jgi:hypothetical protein
MASHVTPGHAGPVLNASGLRWFVDAPADHMRQLSLGHPECLAELASDKMLELVNDKFLIADNTFHQIADRDQSNSLFLLNDTQAF